MRAFSALSASGFEMLHDVDTVVVGAVEIDIDAPHRVVHMALEFAAGIIAARRADAAGDRAVVLKTVLDDVAIVGGVEAAPENERLAAADSVGRPSTSHRDREPRRRRCRRIAQHFAAGAGLVAADIHRRKLYDTSQNRGLPL